MKITLEFEEYHTVKDDIGIIECDMCKGSCSKKNEIWYEGGFGTSMLFVCEECFNKERYKTNKNDVFVKHIENHIKRMLPERMRHGKVTCKICGKTIDEIYEEEK